MWAFNPSTPSKQHAVTMSLESFLRPLKPITSSQYRFYIIQKKRQWFFFPCKQLFLNVLVYKNFHTKKQTKVSVPKTCRLCFGSFFPSPGRGFCGNLLEGGDRILQTGYHSMCHCLFRIRFGSDGWEGMFNEQL